MLGTPKIRSGISGPIGPPVYSGGSKTPYDLNISGDFWSTSSVSPQSETSNDHSGPDYGAQRANLALVAKIATRALIDPCLEKSTVISESYPPLVQFLFVLGKCSI